MRFFLRSNHPIAHWWRCVDRGALLILLTLLGFSAAVSVSASGAVADGYGVDAYYFARRQILFLVGAVPVMLFFSFLTVQGVRNMALVLFLVAMAGVALTIFGGAEVKGAQRWVDVFGVRLQPSELLKPAFVVLTGWLMSTQSAQGRIRGFFVSGFLLFLIAALLLLQPDFGMFMLISLIWFGQMFFANLAPFLLVGLLSIVFMLMSVGYVFLPHVRSRLSRFVDPASGDSYQVDRAQQAFVDGGLFGRGPGEGVVKNLVPDAHTDFILAVIAEEFGIITCVLLLVLYSMLMMRLFTKLIEAEDRFAALAGSGLLLLFGTQVMINMGVALHLLPTTGMTLPFVSYGGSSMLAMAITMGFLLALTRRKRDGLIHDKKTK